MKVYGPYLREDGRMHVIIHYDNGVKITQSYPRYLYEQFHKVNLKTWEDIHHKDNDHTNNCIDNLEIKNNKLHVKEHNTLNDAYHKTFISKICPQCKIEFHAKISSVRNNQNKKKRPGPFCSRKCSGIHNALIKWAG